MTTRRTIFLILLSLLAAGCSKQCCPEQDCIGWYDLGDPKNCVDWAKKYNCGDYPVPGPIVKIKKPGSAGTPGQVEYTVNEVSQVGVDFSPGMLRDNFIGIDILMLKCLNSGTWLDAQHIKIVYSDRTLEIKRTSLDTLLWKLTDSVKTVTLEPTGEFSEGEVPNVLLGTTTKIEDIVLNKTCDEVKLRVMMPGS